MDENIRIGEMAAQIRSSQAYQQKLEVFQRLTPAYHALWGSLTQAQQQVLEDYLAACEALDQELLTSAAKVAGGSLTEELYYLLKIHITYTELRRRAQAEHQA